MTSSGRVVSFENGVLASREQTKESRSSVARQLDEWLPSKNTPAQFLNWHGASRANSLQGVNFIMEQTNIQAEVRCIIVRLYHKLME